MMYKEVNGTEVPDKEDFYYGEFFHRTNDYSFGSFKYFDGDKWLDVDKVISWLKPLPDDKYLVIEVNSDLDKYNDKTLFPEKLEKANETIKKVGSPNQVMSELEFVEVMNLIQQQLEHDTKCHEAFKVILPDDYVSSYNNDYYCKALMKLLKSIFKDEFDNIEYFIWELDFGKKWKENSFTIYGKSIDISDAGKLYNFLIKQI